MNSSVCHFWTGKYVQSCRANKNAYYLSQFEISEYCKSNIYKVCPFYIQKVVRTADIEVKRIKDKINQRG
jgi:hypothetical protein